MDWDTALFLAGGVGAVAKGVHLAVTGYEEVSVTYVTTADGSTRKDVERKEHWLGRELGAIWLLGGGVLLFLAVLPGTPGAVVRWVTDAKGSASQQVGGVVGLVMLPIVFVLGLILPAIGIFDAIDAIRERDLRELGSACLILGFAVLFLGFIALSWWTAAFG